MSDFSAVGLDQLRAPRDYVPFDAPLNAVKASGGMGSVFDRACDGLDYSNLPVGRPSLGDLVPAPLQGPSLRPLHQGGAAMRVARARRKVRDYVQQQNAIDAPFAALQRDEWKAKQISVGAAASPERSDGEPAALGFTTIETSVTKERLQGSKRPLRDRLLVDPRAKRLKRMRSTVNHAARLLHFDAHTERHAQLWNKKFLTLTYANGDDWEPGHLSAFRMALAQWCRRRGVRLRFVWVAELQGRGAIHYHVIVWLPKGKYLPFADAQGWWPHGRTNIVNAQSPIGYITKYASKATVEGSLGFPKGARICGHGGLDPEGRRHIRYWNAPFWVRDALSGRADIRKVVGGYCDRFTGEFLPSPWRVEVGADGQVWAYRIDQLPVEQAA